MSESASKPYPEKLYYEEREFFGIYEYRTDPNGAWKAMKDANNEIMKVRKIPKII